VSGQHQPGRIVYTSDDDDQVPLLIWSTSTTKSHRLTPQIFFAPGGGSVNVVQPGYTQAAR